MFSHLEHRHGQHFQEQPCLNVYFEIIFPQATFIIDNIISLFQTRLTEQGNHIHEGKD